MQLNLISLMDAPLFWQFPMRATAFEIVVLLFVWRCWWFYCIKYVFLSSFAYSGSFKCFVPSLCTFMLYLSCEYLQQINIKIQTFLWNFELPCLLPAHPLWHPFIPPELLTCPVIPKMALSEIKEYESCLRLNMCQDFMERLTSLFPTYT